MKKNIFLTFLQNVQWRVLDAGFWAGWVGRYLRSINPNIELIGVDLDIYNMDTWEINPYDQVHELNLYDLWKNKKNLGKFDAIISFHVFEHIAEDRVDTLAKDYYDILNTWGILIIETPHPITKYTPSFLGFYFWRDPTHVRPYSSSQLESIFSRHGFKTLYTWFDQSIFTELERSTHQVSFLKRLLYRLGIMKSAGVYIGKK